MAKPSVDQTTSFQNAFDYFNKKLFKSELPEVMLNFSRSGARTIAFYAPKRWEKAKRKGDALDEISLSPKFLGRSLDEIFSSLVHEQCHLWQYTHGNPSRAGYHNAEWSRKMIEVGLQPDDGNGNITGQSMSHRIIPDGKFEKTFNRMPKSYRLPWLVFVEEGEEGNPQDPSDPDLKGKRPRSPSGVRIKYECPKCNAHVWGKAKLKLKCVDCKRRFKVVG